MGTKMERWAARQVLPPGDYRVLIAMAQVAHDDTGKFFLHVDKFLSEDKYRLVHRMPSHAALRQHYVSLRKRGLIGRIRKGNGRWLDRTKNPPYGSATVYQLLAYGELPAEAFEQYEAAVRKRGDTIPPRAKNPLPQSPEVSTRPHIQDSLDVTPRPHIQDSLDVTPRPHIQDAGRDAQTSHPGAHDDHVIYDQPPTTMQAVDGGVDETIHRFINACRLFGAIEGLKPSRLSRLRQKLIETGYELSDEDSVFIAEQTMQFFLQQPEDSWTAPERIVGYIEKKASDLIFEEVHFNVERMRRMKMDRGIA